MKGKIKSLKVVVIDIGIRPAGYSPRFILKRGGIDMGDKGKKDKGRKEELKKAKLNLKEKRKMKKEKKR